MRDPKVWCIVALLGGCAQQVDDDAPRSDGELLLSIPSRESLWLGFEEPGSVRVVARWIETDPFPDAGAVEWGDLFLNYLDSLDWDYEAITPGVTLSPSPLDLDALSPTWADADADALAALTQFVTDDTEGVLLTGFEVEFSNDDLVSTMGGNREFTYYQADAIAPGTRIDAVRWSFPDWGTDAVEPTIELWGVADADE